ncbi:tyrosine-type recombinase/integrase [Bacteroides ovatus]|nr:tyrosine-type recombinase/integrase [Bacteroides ovatus]
MLVILIFTVKVEKYVVYIFRKICVQKLRNGSKKKYFISGYIFLNRFGERITTRGIAQQLKHFAEKYGMNKEVVYPHSFRHRFAKNFLDRFNDLALLADLMGHESIETTRIYLRRTASEQQKIVDKVVNW